MCDTCPNNPNASQGSCVDNISCMPQAVKDTFENSLKDLLNTIIANPGNNGSIQQASNQFITINNLEQKFQGMRDSGTPTFFSQQTVYIANSNISYNLGYGGIPTEIRWYGANFASNNEYLIETCRKIMIVAIRLIKNGKILKRVNSTSGKIDVRYLL